ncbi:5-oxoprolinase subunit B family protein [Allostreptomyces psammosilenae]|uniref:Allophanate hydrolase subunit 1 n=1 Tax=Allostreptomyces psammosilenae TaxID=1892865 RepID=A0A853A0Z2_9ACTN|nr:allophanate hydrolase subunit 1 [Allostreptomyces psammosilenae]NYI08226.1 allophanate hydrolase subunit 1 [Allostreptomyces psammosilenae]
MSTRPTGAAPAGTGPTGAEGSPPPAPPTSPVAPDRAERPDFPGCSDSPGSPDSSDSPALSLRPVGGAALLAECGDGPEETARLFRALAPVAAERGWELVPAARTVLVRFDERTDDLFAVGRTVRAVATGSPHDSPGVASRPPEAPLVVPVRYDGPDLAEVASRLGLDVPEVVALHSSAEYTVAFCGFTPGFGYLTGTPEPLHLPRRATPRTRVPAGSVAVAGGFTGMYPTASPGGWWLLGSTDAPLWDVHRQPPALLTPGRRVRLEPVRAGAGAQAEGDR